ncbi:PQQ-binding-like beta-propeller repeat protein [Candidatus Bathyarchaeota archaeon]|nr:PQQ-binding-like beta-propeller repeat protein [Candidatus Bathyarchaeota archaeon]
MIPATLFSHSDPLKTFVTAHNQDTEYPWLMFLHDLEHTSYTVSPVPRISAVLWSYTMGGTSWGPVVAYGKVFLGSIDKKVYALDQMTGAKIWEFATGNAIWVSPAVSNGKVFIGSTDGKVYALDQSNGAKLWEFNIGVEIGSSLSVADGKVYVGSIDGKIYALDESTGAKIWEFATGKAIVFSSPAISGDLLFIGSCDGYLYALDKYTGRERWRAEVSDGRWYVISSPAVSGGKVFIGSSAYNKTYAFDAYTGSLIWEYMTGGRIAASPAIAYNKVFIGSTDGKVYALDQSNGAKLWEFNIGAGAVLQSTVADGMVIVPSGDGKIYALHQSNGSKVWDITVGGAGESGTYPAIADGKIYIVFGNTLYAIISRSTLTISLSETRTNVGGTVIVTGKLSPARLNASIIIERRNEGETTWRTLASVLTNATGHYIYSWVPDAAGSFELRAIWEGDAYALASQSSTQTITVELSPSTLSISISQTRTRAGSTVTIEGSLSPVRSGASIVIRWRREGETTWRTLTTVTTDAAGHYVYNWRADTEGSFELMAYWEGDASTLASQSEAQVITVEPSPPLITTELLIAIIAVVGVAVAAIAYIRRRPKKPKPSGLRISANPKEIFADGESTSNITVELVDAQGNQIPAERDTGVSFNATDGRIAGSITIPKGRSSATTILTSSTKIGTISVTASARGLTDARTEVIFKEKKRYCMYCGRRMPLEAKICPSCGNAPPSGVDTKICRNCGTIIPEVARFCRECGASQAQ